jgi:predicted phosphodiesterase
MKILVISDLHITKKAELNTFEWENQKFINFLNKIIQENEIDKVILNGDIYDIYQYPYNEIKKDNQDIIDYLSGDKFIYIKGNHDFFMKDGLYEYNITNSDGKTIHIEHGHEADFLNGTGFGRWIGRTSFDILRHLMKYNFVKNQFYKIMAQKNGDKVTPREYNTYKYLKYAIDYMKKYDVIILGHTHKLETFKTYFTTNKKRYLNSGSCTFGRFQGVVLDTETLKFKTIKITKDEIMNNIK